MKAYKEGFSEDQYIRVHRSFIIRLDAIEDVQDDTISFGCRLIGKAINLRFIPIINIKQSVLKPLPSPLLQESEGELVYFIFIIGIIPMLNVF